MKLLRFTLASLIAFVGLLYPASLFAQSAGNGTVTGRVSNAATQKYLTSAEIVDTASKRSAYTDADGSYILVLPDGEHTLTVNYGGLDKQQTTVAVVAGETVTRDFALTSADYEKDIVKLDKFVVSSGEREGRMASIAQQKASDVLVSVISSDEFPNVAGANLGDFLRNIPGIDIPVTNGPDPREFMVRGMDSQMSGVTSDGMRMANAAGTDGNTRSFNLDQISIQNYETIEVYKTPTAAMSADSGAGSVNLVSKSAFNLKRARITFQAGGMLNTENAKIGRVAGSSGNDYSIRPVGNLYYANSFLRNRLGVVFTANYNDFYAVDTGIRHRRRTVYERDISVGTYLAGVPDTEIYTRDVSYGYGTGFTRRTSVSLNFDYKLTPYIKLYSNNQLNTSYINSGKQSLTLGDVHINSSAYEGGTVTGIMPDHYYVNGAGLSIPVWSPYVTTAVTGATDVRANTVQDAANSKSGVNASTGLEILNKIGRGTMFSLGAEYKRNGWKINIDGGISLSTNHYTTEDGMAISSATAYLRGIDFRIDQSPGSDYPLITQLNGPDMYDLANYVSRATASSALVSVPGTNRNVPTSPGGPAVVIPGVSTDRTYPNVQMARGDYGPFIIGNGRWLSTKDSFTTAKFDVRRNFATHVPMYLQVGGLFRAQERHTDKNGQSRWVFNGTTEELQHVLESVKSPDLNATFGPYRPVPYFSLPYIDQYFREHPGKFREDLVFRTENQLKEDKVSQERVAGGYGMFNIKLRNFNALLGVRYESTTQSGRGAITDNDGPAVRASEMLMDYVRGFGYADITSAYNETAVNPVTGVSGQQLVGNFTVNQEQALELSRLRFAKIGAVDKIYDDWFPNIQLKYNFNPNFLARASYNKSIARQPFDRLLPGYEVTADTNGAYTVTMNNPSLKPIYFNNYDIALEYYTRQGGIFSIGYYFKDVKNYTAKIVETIAADGVYDYDFSNYILAALEHPMNIGGARHWGIEASISQRLGFISTHLTNFQIYVAYTYQDGETTSRYGSEDAATGLNDLPPTMPAFRLVPKKYQINLNYKNRRLSASLSYNWAGRHVFGEMHRIAGGKDASAFSYLWRDSRGTLDASASYVFYRNYSFYAEVKNLTDEPVRSYFHNRNWTWEYNKYGAFIYFGIKGAF